MAREEGSGDFVAGFLLGAFVGAVLALLFAPAPGEEVRSQIREKGIELKDKAGIYGVEAGKRADELKAKGRTLLEGQTVRFKEAIEEGKKAAARKKEELLAQLEGKSSDEAVELTEQDA